MWEYTGADTDQLEKIFWEIHAAILRLEAGRSAPCATENRESSEQVQALREIRDAIAGRSEKWVDLSPAEMRRRLQAKGEGMSQPSLKKLLEDETYPNENIHSKLYQVQESAFPPS